MIIKRFIAGIYGANCYIITDENKKESSIVDPGGTDTEIFEYIISGNLKVKYILLTHGHLDHIGGVEYLREKTGAKVAIHKNDAPMLLDSKLNLSGMSHNEIICRPADILLKDIDILNLGELKIEVLHTPGHTPGGVCFKIDNVCFTGDTLFKNSIGRIDFPGGDFETIISSINNKLFNLNNNIIIYPGHGENSTIGQEKENNPFFKK